MKQTAITPEQIEKIKAADLGNIVKKVKAGKTLTSAERKMLDEYAGEDVPSDGELVTTTRLAQIFQINRKTIFQWRKENREGIPKKKNNKEPLSEWRSYFAANPSAGHFDGKPRLDRETLLCEKLEVQIELEKVKLAKEQGRLVSVEDIEERDTRIGAAVRAAMLQLTNDLPPTLAGLTEAQVAKKLVPYTKSILTQLANEQSEFWKDQELDR